MSTTATSPPPARASMNGKPVLWRPAKTVLNLHSKFQDKLLCDGPTFSAGDACAYSCSFCYVPAQNRKLLQPLGFTKTEADHVGIIVRRTDAIETLEKQIKSLPDAVRNQELTLYMSPSVDVAANMEFVHETIEACTVILYNTAWHVRMLSKSNLLPKIAKDFAKDEYNKSHLIFGVSTGTLDDTQAAAFEQGCPKVSKRLEALYWLQDNGFRTFGMICPSLPQRAYTQWATDILAAIRPDQCEHIWAEVINVRGDSLANTVKCLHAAGYEWQAAELSRCAGDKEVWEYHSRQNFLALKNELNYRNQFYNGPYKPGLAKEDFPVRLRFLQYVTRPTREWWELNGQHDGAVLL